MTCACQSYNRPDLGGTDPEMVLLAPEWSSRGTICVDACLAPAIQLLWAAGFETRGCCCGHNGALGPTTVIVADHEMDTVGALNLLRLSHPDGKVLRRQGGELVEAAS